MQLLYALGQAITRGLVAKMEMGSVQHRSLKFLGEGMGYPVVQAFFLGALLWYKKGSNVLSVQS